jgi:hypothetical protein
MPDGQQHVAVERTGLPKSIFTPDLVDWHVTDWLSHHSIGMFFPHIGQLVLPLEPHLLD